MKVGIEHNVDPLLDYPRSEHYFSPHERYPEYPFGHLSPEPNLVYQMVRQLLCDMRMDEAHYGTSSWNPLGEWVHRGQTVFALVNFVTERRPLQRRVDFSAMVTHPAVIRALLDYLIIATGDPALVLFGNAPVQSARMDMIAVQTGAGRVQEFYLRETGHHIGPHDLRLYVSHVNAFGSLTGSEELDPSSEVTFDLGSTSLLDRLPDNAFAEFRVEDYGSEVTRLFHSRARHLYKLHRRVLESDVLFHIAKLKTHGKVGLTCALKGAVGSISRKECLAHHRCGAAQEGGDEYKDLTWLTKIYGALGERVTSDCANSTRIAHKSLARLLDWLFRVNIRGSWYGNDTAWRMALDINRCLVYGDLNGKLSDRPVRKVYALLDGVVSGEGDGPIYVRSRKDGLLILSDNPCLADLAAALVMGFDPTMIPLIREAFRLSDFHLSSARLDEAAFLLNGAPVAAEDIPGKIVPAFRPPRGWVGHIEYGPTTKLETRSTIVESIVGNTPARL